MNDPAKHYTERSTQHDPDQSYPDQVKLQVQWNVDGHVRVRSVYIDADQFYGRGAYGAPIEGIALLNYIEHMRRAGPPPVEQKGKKHGVRKNSR